MTSSGAAIEVVAGGLLTTVQDVVGRAALGALGVRAGGAMDEPAARLANRLVGNADHLAVLEVTGLGPTLRLAPGPRVVAITGADLGASLDADPVPPGRALRWRAQTILSFGDPRAGLRAYVAISGGIDVPRVLGSAATDLQFAFGGLAGRALRAGDRLPLGPAGERVAGRYVSPRWLPPDPDQVVHIVAGPHLEAFEPGALAALCARPWSITAHADRMGYRLRGGESLVHRASADVTTIGLPIGAIQVPADGLPIVLLADHQPTGGYTVPAVVIQADLPLFAQRGPGATVRFAVCSAPEARDRLRRQRAGSTLAGDEGEFTARWA